MTKRSAEEATLSTSSLNPVPDNDAMHQNQGATTSHGHTRTQHAATANEPSSDDAPSATTRPTLSHRISLLSSYSSSSLSNSTLSSFERRGHRTVSCRSTVSSLGENDVDDEDVRKEEETEDDDADVAHARKHFKRTHSYPHHDDDDDGRNLLRFVNARILSRDGSLSVPGGSLTVDLATGTIVSMVLLPEAEEERADVTAGGRETFRVRSVVDCQNQILSPGYIDIQLNGCYGVDFSNAGDVIMDNPNINPATTAANMEINPENEERTHATAKALTVRDVMDVSARLTRTGVTSFCPTMVSSSKETYRKILPLIRRARMLQRERRTRWQQQQRQGKQQCQLPPQSQSQQSQSQYEVGANILGMHLEGPFFAPSKRGAHDERHICSPIHGIETVVEVYGLSSDGSNDLDNDDDEHDISREGIEPPTPEWQDVEIITLAPELEGAFSAIASLTKTRRVSTKQQQQQQQQQVGETHPSQPQHPIVVSMGHTSATYQDGLTALSHGATLLTHLYNAMNPFHHRDPGLVGLLSPHVEMLLQKKLQPQQRQSQPQHPPSESKPLRPFYSLIADGIHVHPTAVSLAHRAHPAGCVLVTDAMSAMGLGDGIHSLGNMSVQIVGERATLANSDVLAGSVATMERCVKNLREFAGCGVGEALLCGTWHPARVLGRDVPRRRRRTFHGGVVREVVEPPVGVLEVGAAADLILVNDELDVLETWVGGRLAYKNEERIAKLRA